MELVIHASSHKSQAKRLKMSVFPRKKYHCTTKKIGKFAKKRASSRQQSRLKRILIINNGF